MKKIKEFIIHVSVTLLVFAPALGAANIMY